MDPIGNQDLLYNLHCLREFQAKQETKKMVRGILQYKMLKYEIRVEELKN